MATFKVGQRVRIVRRDSVRFGKEGTILGVHTNVVLTHTGLAAPLAYSMEIDGLGRRNPSGLRYGYPPEDLAPLTDPKAEEFMELIKKLGREPVGHKETVEEGK